MLSVHAAELPLTNSILTQDIGVEELAKLGLGAIRRRICNVVGGLSMARGGAKPRVRCGLSEKFVTNVGNSTIAIRGSVTDCSVEELGCSIASDDLVLDGSVAVSASDGDLE